MSSLPVCCYCHRQTVRSVPHNISCSEDQQPCHVRDRANNVAEPPDWVDSFSAGQRRPLSVAVWWWGEVEFDVFNFTNDASLNICWLLLVLCYLAAQYLSMYVCRWSHQMLRLLERLTPGADVCWPGRAYLKSTQPDCKCTLYIYQRIVQVSLI